MKKSVVVWLPAVLFACMFTTAHAAEEQIVIDDLTAPQLRDEIKKFESEFYRVFNTLNSNDEMDIICHRFNPTRSNIKREVCEPQFVIDRRGQNATDYQNDRDDLLSPIALQHDLDIEFKALTEEMDVVAKQNSYFQDLGNILADLRARLEEI
jgi:hypothetical protein